VDENIRRLKEDLDCTHAKMCELEKKLYIQIDENARLVQELRQAEQDRQALSQEVEFLNGKIEAYEFVFQKGSVVL
jgi:uncharacterized protein YlxW (UPF0749 family)